jgi:glycosyltransferase involved in cell wall biosynthesis
MKVAVVNNCVPFIRGGAEHLAEALTRKLNDNGHEAILIKLPFRWQPPEKILEHMLACRCIRLSNVDRVIGLKFPAYYVPHASKVLWLLHQFRQAYDLWGTPLQDLPNTQEGLDIRNIIIRSDNQFLRESHKIYTNSHVTGERLQNFNGIESTVLFPPLLETAHLKSDGYGDHVFFPSRITSGKRQFLAVESMKYVKTGVRLVIAGDPETPADLSKLESIIQKNGLEGKVKLIPRFISEQEKAEILAGALACIYLPYDEDSYGYVTLEACHARKPVITCEDSGGIRILVKHGVTGYIVPPEPRELAEAMDRLYANRKSASLMGDAGHELMLSLKITWDHVIETLTA